MNLIESIPLKTNKKVLMRRKPQMERFYPPVENKGFLLFEVKGKEKSLAKSNL